MKPTTIVERAQRMQNGTKITWHVSHGRRGFGRRLLEPRSESVSITVFHL